MHLDTGYVCSGVASHMGPHLLLMRVKLGFHGYYFLSHQPHLFIVLTDYLSKYFAQVV